MALDKQRILSELGSVVNQLQNSDCGCMGKMFSNPGHGGNCLGNPLPTCGGCRRGTCPGHGYAVNHMSGGGDPYMGGGMDTGGGMEGGMGMHGGGMGMHGGGMGMHGGGMGMQGGGMGMRGGMGGGMGMRGGGMGMGGRGMGMGGGGMGMGGGGMDMGGGGMDMGGGGMGMGGGGMGMGGGGMGMGGGGMGMGGGGMGMGGGRNAPKLYADTYNYLNKNLMQPVMEEVYNDLKTITPENTIGNNPLAAKMGLSMNQGGAGGMTGAPGMTGAHGLGGASSMQPMGVGGGNMMQGMGGVPGGTSGDMSKMGAQMVNMMMSGGRGKTPHLQPGNLGQQMGISEPQPGADMGMTNMTPSGGINPNQPETGMSNMGQGNPTAMMQNPVTQYATSGNMNAMNGQGGTMPQGNSMGGNMPIDNRMNPAVQQMQSVNPTMQQNMGNANPPMQQTTNPYGQHTAGIKKFNEMFPGVMQGGLDFDPMAIAMQMNPANQRQTAIDQITKVMYGNKGNLQPALDGTNAAAAALRQPNAVPQNQITNQQILSQPGQNNVSPVGQPGIYPGTNQQVYAAQGSPAMAQQIPQQQILQEQIQGQEGQLQIDPNTGAPIMPEQGMVDPNSQIQEPIHPTNVYNAPPQDIYYNTLGQPIQMLPRSTYQTSMPDGLPQTLGGSYGRAGYGIKNTLSKTALSTNIPIGKAASKSQLQHIYRQYKASHSQPNFRPPAPVHTGSHSLAQLNTPPVTANQNAVMHQQMQQIPVEKVGGDTIANNQQLKMEQPVGKIGDSAPSNLQAGDTAAYEKTSAMPVGRVRNGLQDVKFSNYHTSAAWSFHG